jgi:hypothetical protein
VKAARTDPPCAARAAACLHRTSYDGGCMFIFFSNKLGWVGSILVSIVLSLLLIALFAFF